MASNPVPVPLLSTLGTTPQQKKDLDALRMYLYLIREQIGGDSAYSNLSEAIDANTIDININAVDIALLDGRLTIAESDIDDLEALTGISVVTTAIDITGDGNQIIRCTAGLTVTLDVTPADRQFTIVYHDGITGDAVLVTDGASTDTIKVKNSVVGYTYYSDLSKWVP